MMVVMVMMMVVMVMVIILRGLHRHGIAGTNGIVGLKQRRRIRDRCEKVCVGCRLP